MINAAPPPTGPDGAVDWDAVVARSRRSQLRWSPAFALWVGCFAVTIGGARYVITSLLVGVVAGALIAWGLSRVQGGRPTSRHAVIAEYALVHHLDPGPPAREVADRRARTAAATRWSAPLFAVLGVSQLQRLDDDVRATPVTVGAFCLLLLGFVAIAGWTWRLGLAGQRWSAAPPGPPRPAPTMTPREGWVTGRGYKITILVGLACSVVGLALQLGERVLGW